MATSKGTMFDPTLVKDLSCSGITSSTSYVPVFDSNIITLPEGENTIEIRLSAQANTATAYIGRYHKLGFIVAEL